MQDNEIEVGKRYKLYAPWHPANGQFVEVIMKRDGMSPSYHGRMIYHIATDPGDAEKRVEDLDSEFIESHLHDPMEKMISAPLEEYLDDKGLQNAETLRAHGIDIALFKDENGDHYLEIGREGKSDLIKIEDYNGILEKADGYEDNVKYITEDEDLEDDNKGGPPNPLCLDED